MTTVLLYAIWFIVAIAILVAVHEYGHFWVARRLGVKVLRFSLGFGKPLLRRRGRDGTEYVVAAIPLGGYVKMLDEREGEVSESERHLAFNNKPLSTRIAVVIAGPLFNFLFALVVLWAMFMSGVPQLPPHLGAAPPDSPAQRAGLVENGRIVAVDGTEMDDWQAVRLEIFNAALADRPVVLTVQHPDGRQREHTLDVSGLPRPVEVNELFDRLGLVPWTPPPILGEVLEGPAKQAGLRPGDRILSVDGIETPTWREWALYLHENPGKAVIVRFERQGQHYERSLTVAQRPESEPPTGYINVRLDQASFDKFRVERRYGPIEAIGQAGKRIWELSELMIKVLGYMISGDASVKNLSGPLTIAEYAGKTAEIGLMAFIDFLALVSISLGVLNLLPIPVLDGGHLLYYVIEGIKGSPLSEQAQALGQQIGLVLLLALMTLAFYNDLIRLFG